MGSTTFQDLPPHLLYKILIQESLSVLDLVHVEATCYAFRAAPGLLPLRFKSIVEIAVVDLCNAHPLYSLLPPLHRKQLLRRCGCNWKMLLRYLQSTEQANARVLSPKGKVQVAAGKYHSLVLAGDKGVFACGSGLPFVYPDDRVLCETSGLFVHVEMPQNVLVTQVASSHQHVAFITSSGEFYTYGDNKSGCCGLDENNQSSIDFEEANEIVIEPRLVIALKETSCKQVYTWGKGYCGALGHGHEADGGVPKRVATLSEVRAVQVCSKKRRTFVLSDDGRLYGFGWMGFGSLGLSQKWISEKVLVPSVLDSLKDHHISQVSAGLYHTLVVTSKGTILGFGDNDKGPLGVSRSSSCPEPIEVVAVDHLEPI